MNPTENELLRCPVCGCKAGPTRFDITYRSDGSIYRYHAAIDCDNPVCWHFVVGQHKSKTKAERLAIEAWQREAQP